MHWSTAQLPSESPFVALRRNFERQLGLENAPAFAAMSVREYPDRWVVAVDVPGVTESDVNVTFVDGSLIIEGERKPQATEGATELFNDRSFRKFRRVLKVKEAINQDAIEADLSAGVLTLTLHRTPEATPKKIAIRAAGA